MVYLDGKSYDGPTPDLAPILEKLREEPAQVPGMGLIDVRRFLVQTWFDDGVLKAGEPELAKEDMWDVNLAEVIR